MKHLAPQPSIPDYELIRCIGRGAYGDVWLARGLTGIYRAIKIVWRDRFAEPDPFEREFNGLREFSVFSLVGQSQLALLHAGRNDSDGFFYYVMELADDAETGGVVEPERYVPLTLKELRLRRGRIRADEAIAFAVELAKGLASLHRHGLVHRDIKPSNVVVVNGQPKLADIGLVASRSDAASYVGTDGFVAPEGPGTPAADVYALGKLLYELSTGLDRRRYPCLPDGIEQLEDRRALLELNEILLRACEPSLSRRYPDAPALLADLTHLQAGRSLRQRRARRAALRLGAIVAGLGLLAGAVLWGRRAVAAASVPSIAVLPFDNLSENRSASAFFADGFHEDILSDLAHMGDFRVVSRTTVLQYRDSKKTIRQIAQELGVNYVLEGSVERSAAKVRVTGQLIDARSDRVLWSKSYDRALSDLFSIQTEVAAEIAHALDQTVNPAEEGPLRRPPTTNVAAYDLFLRARDLRNADPTKAEDREPLLEKAVALDPSFAEAWGDLADVHAYIYFSCHDHGPERLAKARDAMERATRLAPDSFDVVESLGTYYYYGYRDYAAATAQYERLARQYPRDPTIYSCISLIQRRQGHWSDAVVNQRKSLALDPRNIGDLRTLVDTLESGRRFAEAMELQRRILALEAPGSIEDRYHLAEMAFFATGSSQAGDDFFRTLPPNAADSADVLACRKDWALDKGDVAEAIRLDHVSPYTGEFGMPRFMQAFYLSMAYAAAGDRAAARARLAGIPDELREMIRSQPDNASYWAFLGGMEAILGQSDAADRDAGHAMVLVPESLDAIDGVAYHRMLNLVQVWTGRTDAALADLPRLLSLPCGDGNCGQLIKRCAWYRPLQQDPRFLAIANDPKSNAALF